RSSNSENVGRLEGSMPMHSLTKHAKGKLFSSLLSIRNPSKIAFSISESAVPRNGFSRNIISYKITPNDHTSLARVPAPHPPWYTSMTCDSNQQKVVVLFGHKID